MNANVRCAEQLGCQQLGSQHVESELPCSLPRKTHIVSDHRYKPCGWKGRRYGTGNAHRWDDPDIRDAEIARLRTAKPCPRCGGQVELIERQP